MQQEAFENWVSFISRLPSLFIGLFLFAAGVVANLYSNLGMAPWGVLNVGLINYLPFTIGQISQLIGLIVIFIGWGLGFAPGFGTLCNMYFVGWFIDVIMEFKLLPQPNDILGQFSLLIFSVVLLGVGSLFYLRVRLGAGPRDGLMVGFVKKLDKPVWFIRGAIEVTVLTIGWLLGGPVGIGTVVTALTVGYTIQIAFKLGRFDGKSNQMNLWQLYQYLRGRSN